MARDTVAPEVKILFERETIRKRISQLSDAIKERYPDAGNLLIIPLQTGAMFFAVDLLRSFRGPQRPMISSVIVNTRDFSGSYFGKTRDLARGRDLLILDDIFDTGKTLEDVYNYYKNCGAKTICSCFLLNKRIPKVTDLKPDFIGFDVEDLYVVGYGLDADERYRELENIGYLE